MRLFQGSSNERLTEIVGTIERVHVRRGMDFEVVHGVTFDVSPIDSDELISIRTFLFVSEANGMQQFMDDRSLRCTTRKTEGQILRATALPSSQVRPTATTKKSRCE